MKQNNHLLNALRLATAASALALAFGAALAQGPVPGVPGIPRIDQPSQRSDNPGGGGGVGITIDLGSIFNAIKNATRKDRPDKEDPKKPPLLQKSAVAITSGSGGNYVIDWVVQYANNTGATLPAVVVKDGPIATIIPGSLQPPPIGWTATTNSSPPVDNFALWTGTSIAPHGVMTATFPAAGAAVVNVGAGGDGFQPIPYVHPSGRRIYVINHHTPPSLSATPFDCVDISLGTRCAGAWPRRLPFGDGTSAPSGTNSNNSEYVINGSKIYYPAQNLVRWGIGCYDLNTDSQCGFTQLDTAGSSIQQTMLQGPWRVGNELYLADYKGQIYCAQLTASLPACLSSGYKIPLSDIKLNVPTGNTTDWSLGLIAGKVINNRLYLTSRLSNVVNTVTTKTVSCIDATTKQACWNTLSPTRGSGITIPDRFAINYSNFI